MAFAPYLPHCYWYCLPPTQQQLCWGLYRNAECADEGKLLSYKLAWFAYQQNGLVKFDFPLSTCDGLISKNCQNWQKYKSQQPYLLIILCIVYTGFRPTEGYLFVTSSLSATIFEVEEIIWWLVFILVFFKMRLKNILTLVRGNMANGWNLGSLNI